MGSHILTFLAVASIKKFTVDLYTDNAEGILEKDSSRKMVMNCINLRPQIVFSGNHNPTQQELEELNEKAHKGCFIANSIKSAVIIEQQ